MKTLLNIWYAIIIVNQFILVIGCNKRRNETFVIFINQSISSPTSINKSNFFGFGTVYRLDFNSNQAEKFDNALNNFTSTSLKNIDIRYLFVHKGDTIGLDKYGNTINYSKNNLIRNHGNINDLVKNIIDHNKEDIEVIKKGDKVPDIPKDGFSIDSNQNLNLLNKDQ